MHEKKKFLEMSLYDVSKILMPVMILKIAYHCLEIHMDKMH